MKKTFKYILVLTFGFTFLSCGDEFLDINDDPNYAKDAPAPDIFPAAVISTAGVTGGEAMIIGGIWSQFWTQSNASNQYKTYDQFNITPTTFQTRYRELFTGALNDYKEVMVKARESEDWNFFLMATVMRAYTYQFLVDIYGKIPYDDALSGEEALNPTWQDGDKVYDALIAEIDTALSKPFTEEELANPEKDFVFDGEHMEDWVRFANTLKLRMYLRQVYARPQVAEEGIIAILNDPIGFLESDAKVDKFVDESFKYNPLYEQDRRALNTANNLRASHTLMSWLEANGDPRLEYLFEKGSGGYKALLQGNHEAPSTEVDPATISRAVVTEVDPVYFITESESYFLQAEAQLRFGDPAIAEEMYENGVVAAFVRLGIHDTIATEDFLGIGTDDDVVENAPYSFPSDGSFDDKFKAIMIQKWASLAGANNIEAFFEINRTGYPEQSSVRGDNPAYVPGQLTDPINSVLSAGQRPKRLLYPDLEMQLNANKPEFVELTVPVWWDK